MEGTAVLGRPTWCVGEVTETVPENAHVTSPILAVTDWPAHQAGQHVDVRLTAEDGYQAVRSYSIASPPEDPRLTVNSLPILERSFGRATGSNSVGQSAATLSGASLWVARCCSSRGAEALFLLCQCFAIVNAPAARCRRASCIPCAPNRMSFTGMNWHTWQERMAQD